MTTPCLFRGMTIFALGLSLALLIVGQAGADARGPRASILSATECTISSDGILKVTNTLTNKSSGVTIPEVRAGVIYATYKPADQRGNAYEELGSVLVADVTPVPAPVDPELILIAEFDLCDGSGNVKTEVQNARELNGLSQVIYGIYLGDGESRVVRNRCTDNLDTLDVNEGGIKVDASLLSDLASACAVAETP